MGITHKITTRSMSTNTNEQSVKPEPKQVFKQVLNQNLKKSDSVEESKPKPVEMKSEPNPLALTPKRKSPKVKKLNIYATRANKSPGKVQPLRTKAPKSHLQKFLIEQQKKTSLSQQATEDIC